jgi:hypothetical protein
VLNGSTLTAAEPEMSTPALAEQSTGIRSWADAGVEPFNTRRASD